MQKQSVYIAQNSKTKLCYRISCETSGIAIHGYYDSWDNMSPPLSWQ